MRIGIIARMDQTGLGIQSKEFFDHIPCKALVIDMSNIPRHTVQNYHWYPGQRFCIVDKALRIPADIIIDFIDDIDVLVTFETPYDYKVFELCRNRGVKTILQLNYEFLEYPSSYPKPDLFASPSLWNFEKIPLPRIHLPVPVDITKFSFDRKPKTFVHVAGNPAAFDRNGTLTFLNCLRYVDHKIDVVVKCQRHIALPKVPYHVRLVKDFNNINNYWENYTGGVLVMPRKYGGLCLPAQEAIAAEMPVIMTNITPNNTWLPSEWLVSAYPAGSFMCKQQVDYFDADMHELAARINQFCDDDFYYAAVNKAIEIKKNISWGALLPMYYSVLGLAE